MTARTERTVLAIAAVVLVGLGFLVCHLLTTTGDEERQRWQSEVDSLLGESADRHWAEVAAAMARADSAAARAQAAAARARLAELARAGADRRADSLRAVTDSIDEDLERATTAADSFPKLVAKVVSLTNERDHARRQVAAERVTAADWRTSYLEEAKRTGELLSRIAKDSVRIVDLELKLDDAPKAARFQLTLGRFEIKPACIQYRVIGDEENRFGAGPTVCMRL